jgi:hypothetical protein
MSRKNFGDGKNWPQKSGNYQGIFNAFALWGGAVALVMAAKKP